jgi:hypothetical protein
MYDYKVLFKKNENLTHNFFFVYEELNLLSPKGHYN